MPIIIIDDRDLLHITDDAELEAEYKAAKELDPSLPDFFTWLADRMNKENLQ